MIGTEEEPVVGGAGSAIEYAVKMHEFPQDALADRLAARGELSVERMDELAATIAAFHARVERAGPASEFGTPAEVIAPARQNFEQIRALLGGAGSGAALGPLAAWTEREFARHARRVRGPAARRVCAGVPRRSASPQPRPARRAARAVRLHRVQRPAALDRRDERGGVPGHGPRRPRARGARVAAPQRLSRGERRLRGARGVALLPRLPGDGAGEDRGAARGSASGRHARARAGRAGLW